MTWTSFVGAGALVPRDGDLLFVRQRRAYGVHWELPGGYYDRNESLEDAARREVLEETGVAVEIDKFVCTLVWERDHDRRRVVQTWFSATLLDNTAEPTPQIRRTSTQSLSSIRWPSSTTSTRLSALSSSVGGRKARRASTSVPTCLSARTERRRISSALKKS